VVATEAEREAIEKAFPVISMHLVGGLQELRIYSEQSPGQGFAGAEADSKMCISSLNAASAQLNGRARHVQDFFLFELKLRFRSISTYVFLLMPFLIAFFAVSTSDFGPIGAGKGFQEWPVRADNHLPSTDGVWIDPYCGRFSGHPFARFSRRHLSAVVY